MRQVPLVFAAPWALFRRVEDTGAYGWPLVVLLALFMLIGWAQVQTGLIDRLADLQTEDSLAQIEKAHANNTDRVELRQLMDDARKSGEFMKTMWRIAAIVLRPMWMLASMLLIASMFYALVAMTGRKPEYHTLMSICVYAAFIELFGYVLNVAMMWYYRSSEVGTTLRPLAAGNKELAAVLGAVDPFRFWFWGLVAMGLIVTHQLGRKTAIASCMLFCLVATAVHAAMAMAPQGGGVGG